MVIKWQDMTAVIEPFYPKAGNGRRPYPLETMLRIHCMQHWYNLSDGAMEDALYEIASMRLFAQLSLDSWLITSCRSANNIMPITFFLPAFIASSFYSA